MKRAVFILLILSLVTSLRAQFAYEAELQDVVADIYSFLTERGETDFEELQTVLQDIAAHPLNINTATADELKQLRFLTNNQVDALLLYVHHHPMESLSELRLIPELKDYEVRNLQPFVYAGKAEKDEPLYIREVFSKARHEIMLRTDGRYMEDPFRDKQTDPVYAQLKYNFNYHNRVQAGLSLRRPTGGGASSLLYGGYLQLKKIKCIETLVAGNFQVQFGQGLVSAYPFHTGKSFYVLNAASSPEGLRKYSTPDGGGMTGAGATLRFGKTDVSAWYSFNNENDSIRRHTVGANVSVRLKNWKFGATITDKIFSDSVSYYFAKAAYNQRYFRGNNQFIAGADMRCKYGMAEVFAEAAAAQNAGSWGYGVVAGTVLDPLPDVGLTLLYRYYSPYFDNSDSYAFSETSRLNDENGLYAGVEVKSLKNWIFSASGDVFYFSGIKYGIPYSPSWGYDAALETMYIPSARWQGSLRLRAREKGRKSTYSLRWRMRYTDGGWQVQPTVEANMAADRESSLGYGISFYQDVRYVFSSVPLSLSLRVQGFYVPSWDNRIYAYESDVLYGYSNNALYGEGGRAYINLKWQIIKQLAMYLRVSETIYTKRWAEKRQMPSPFRTDVHLLFRAVL